MTAKLALAVVFATCLAMPAASAAQEPPPDLVVTSVTVSSTRVAVGETFDYVVTAKNIGGLPCNFITLSISAPDAADFIEARGDSPLICEAKVCRGGPFFLLWPGQSIKARYTWKARRVGLQGTARGTVDPNHRCSEASESNNDRRSDLVTIFGTPRLTVVGHRPANQSIQTPTQVFPLTITNVGTAPATNVALVWATTPNGSSPELLLAYTGMRVLTGQVVSPALPFTCAPNASLCTITVTLQPQEMLQARLRFASCQRRDNAEVHVSTVDDTAPDDHSVVLHRNC